MNAATINRLIDHKHPTWRRSCRQWQASGAIVCHADRAFGDRLKESRQAHAGGGIFRHAAAQKVDAAVGSYQRANAVPQGAQVGIRLRKEGSSRHLESELHDERGSCAIHIAAVAQNQAAWRHRC